MKKLIFLFTVIAAVVTIAGVQSCQSSNASPVKLLKFNLEKGKGYNYEMVWDMDQKIMGNDTKISIGGLFSLDVTDDNGTEKSITGTYKRFTMNMKMMGMEIDVDTDKPSPAMTPEDMQQNPMGMMNRIFSGIAGKSFTMKVDQEGKVLAVSGFDAILQAMADSMGFNETVKEQMMASLKDQFNEQAVKDQFSQILTIFPNKEVKVGDSWKKNFATGGKTPAKFTSEFTVKKIEGDMVTLASTTTIEPLKDEDAGTEVEGTQTGTMQVDSKYGLVVNADFDQKMAVKTGGMTIDIIAKGKIKGRAN